MYNKNDNSNQTQERAMELFLNEYSLLRCIAFEAAPCRDLTNDIVHDTFVQFVKSAEKWDLETDVRALLCKMTRNTALIYWRKHLKTLSLSNAQLSELIRTDLESSMTQIPVGLDDEMELLHECMGKLPPQHREIMEEHYLRGKTLTSLAALYGKNIKAIQKMASRIRAVLRQCVESTLKARNAGRK